MRNLFTLLLCLCITFISVDVSAQDNLPVRQPDLNRPKLFTNLPERIKVDVSQLFSIMDKQRGSTASVQAAETQAIRFDGDILFSVTDEASHLKSVMLNLSMFPGARLTVTQLTHPNGSTEYAGRILSFQHGDAYVLEKENDGYYLIKKNFYDLVND